jgi:hypothetical protein
LCVFVLWQVILRHQGCKRKASEYFVPSKWLALPKWCYIFCCYVGKAWILLFANKLVVWLKYIFNKNLCIAYASRHKVRNVFTFFACSHNWTIYRLVKLFRLDIQFPRACSWHYYPFSFCTLSILTLLHLSNVSPFLHWSICLEFVFHGYNSIVCISVQCWWSSFGVAIIGPVNNCNHVKHDYQNKY